MARIYPEHPLAGTMSNAERKCFYAMKDLLPDDYVVLHDVPVYYRSEERDRLHDGQLDFLVLHPDKGMVVIEVKGGGISRDADTGKWWSTSADGKDHEIKDPFEQGKRYMYDVLDELKICKITSDYRYPAGHAVWFPDIDLGGRDMGISVHLQDITLDSRDLAGADQAVPVLMERCLGKLPGKRPGKRGIEVLREHYAPSWRISVTLSAELAEEKRQILEATRSQYRVLSLLERFSRVLVCGCAGSGKTYLAIEKARRLAESDRRVLIVCFNKRLAEWGRAQIPDGLSIDFLHFHGLCSDIGRKVGLPLPAPDPTADLADYFQYELPDFMMEALCETDFRYDAVIVDEGQDFDSAWWLPLEELLSNPRRDPFYIFYDDNQVLYSRKIDFPIAEPPLLLTENCRNTQSIHELSIQFYDSRNEIEPMCIGPDGRSPEWIRIAEGEDEVTIVGRAIGTLIRDQQIEADDITILTPRSQEKSIWEEGTKLYGCTISWGERDKKKIQCSTIHSFKGLESPVVILTELRGISIEERRELFYVGLSRANHHLLIVSSQPVGTGP
jgi:hypothetical protein